MRISRRTSGGRGEYELSGPSDNGLSPGDVAAREIVLQIGTINLPTATQLSDQGGKRRLRRISGGIQVQRQIAAALMLPAPIRADPALGAGMPVIQTNRYAVEQIQITDARLDPSNVAVLDVESITLRNAMVEAETLPIADRLVALGAVWERRSEFPDEIERLIEQHYRAVTSGSPIQKHVEETVLEIQAEVSDNSSDLGIVYSQQTDVVPALLQALSIEALVQEPTVQVDDVDPEEVEVRRRTVKEWKRWANARGPKSAKFRHDVREAYHSTCAVCGVRLPKTGLSSPGVDAAHILPWSDYDLDETSNGICLCKLHHWAFDEGLLRIVFRDDFYHVELSEELERFLLASNFRDADIVSLKQHVGRIPAARLPDDKRSWPRPQFLEMLNASLESASPEA